MPADNVRANELLPTATPLEHCCGRSGWGAVLDVDFASAQHSTINCQCCSNSHRASRVIQSLGLTVWANCVIILTYKQTLGANQMGYFTDTDFDSTLDMIDAVNEVVERNIRKFDQVPASDLGLDIRCGRLMVDIVDEVIAVPNHNIRMLDYYGGFEYIKEGEGRVTVGDYTFFTSDNERVNDCFEALRDSIDE